MFTLIGDKKAFRHFKLSSNYPKPKSNTTTQSTHRLTPLPDSRAAAYTRLVTRRWILWENGTEASVAFPYLGDEQQVVPGLREAVVDNDAEIVLVVDNLL